MDKKDWDVLDSLSDDYECVSSLCSDEKDKNELIERLYNLWQNGYIFIPDNLEFNIEQLKAEALGNWDTSFWFGLAQKGASFWEENAEKYCGEKIDWKYSWSGIYNYENGQGIIYGTTEEVCRERFEIFKETEGKIIDNQSVKVSPVDEFKAKYYKTLRNGYKLTFVFKPKHSR